MNNPIITASGVIPALSCVKVSTTANTVVVCTTSTDIVFGVTFGADTANGGAVTFQTSDTQLDIVTLRAGGTITAGAELAPDAAGTVVTTTSGQFIAMTAATSGQTLTAYKKKVGSSGGTPAGFFGSNRAAGFLRDAINGTDSVDIITIGDSNAGQNDYGYTNGIDRVMSYSYGATMYATPVLSQGSYYVGITSATYTLAENMIGTGTMNFTAYVDPSVGGSTDGYTTPAAVGSNRLMGYFTDGGNIDALKTFLGINTTILNSNQTCTVAQPNRYMALPTCVATGTTFAGNGLTNYTRLRNWSPLFFNGSADCQYRLVYGTFTGGSGKFKLRASNSLTTTYAISDNFIITSTGSLGYLTATLDFTRSAETFCTWDGGNTPGANLCTGPFAALWGSIIKKSTKGYSVSNFTTSDGRTTAQIYTILGNMDKMLNAFLKEIRERQVIAGGSGRAIVWLNSGINGDTAADWTNNAGLIRDLIAARWVAEGGNLGNLAFIMSVSHPVVTYNNWSTDRPGVAAAANTWATTNTNDGNGVCVVDIAVKYPIAKLSSGSNPYVATNGYLDSGGQQHLNATYSEAINQNAIIRGNGYDAIAGAILSAVITSA